MPPKAFPPRRRAGRSKKAALRCAALALAVAALFALGAFGVFSTNVMRYLLQIYLYIALGQAWNLLSGFSGMTSLGQQLFVGLAGYTVAIVTSTYGGSACLGLAAGALAGALAALLLSRILFRISGMYFAVATWVAAEAVEKLFLAWKYTNQGSGMTVRIVPYPTTGQIYLLSLAVCCGSVALVYSIMRSRMGLGLMAMRDDMEAAQVTGVNLSKIRLIAYVLAATVSALAGGVFFINKGVIYPESGFSVGWTVSSVFICLIGGTGTLSGPVVGAALYVLLREFLAHYPGWSNILLGLITLFVIFFMPEGIVGTLQRYTRIPLILRHRRSDAT